MENVLLVLMAANLVHQQLVLVNAQTMLSQMVKEVAHVKMVYS